MAGAAEDVLECEQLASYSHSDAIWACAVSPDGKVAASVSRDRTVRAVLTRSGNECELNSRHNDAVYDVSLAGGKIATADRHGAIFVRILSSPDEPILTDTEKNSWARAVRLSRDGEKVLYSRCETVIIREVQTEEKLHEMTLGAYVFRLTASADLSRVFMLLKNHPKGEFNFLRVWEPDSYTVNRFDGLWVSDFEDYPGISTDKHGKVLAIADTHSLRLWTYKHRRFVTMPGYVPPQANCDCAITHDGTRVIAAQGAGGFAVWDCTRNIQLYVNDEYSVRTVAIADDGITFAIGYDDESFRVWLLRSSSQADRRRQGRTLEGTSSRRGTLEASVRTRFQSALSRDQDFLTFQAAAELLNTCLQEDMHVQTVSEPLMMSAFQEVADECVVHVYEDVFVNMLWFVLLSEHTHMFRDAVRSGSSLHIGIAARLMRHIRNAMLPNNQSVESVEKSLRPYVSKPDRISEKNFKTALKILVYDA